MIAGQGSQTLGLLPLCLRLALLAILAVSGSSNPPGLPGWGSRDPHNSMSLKVLGHRPLVGGQLRLRGGGMREVPNLRPYIRPPTPKPQTPDPQTPDPRDPYPRPQTPDPRPQTPNPKGSRRLWRVWWRGRGRGRGRRRRVEVWQEAETHVHRPREARPSILKS